jgi:very-long-chain enoyl-CoA reductase
LTSKHFIIPSIPVAMTSRTIKLTVQPRGKPIKGLPEEIDLSPGDSAAELYKRIAGQTGYSIHRLRITKGSDGSLLSTGATTIEQTGLRDRSTIAVKDLGPQIAWRTVFIIEYLGPMLIHPAIYFLRPYVYSTPSSWFKTSTMPPPSLIQTLSMALILIHFAKREFETVFVHRFSLSTMPAFNVFKNSAHYWLLAGLNIAYWTYSPAAAKSDKITILPAIGLALFAIGEVGNLYTHLVLRWLRPEGWTARGIPSGFGFDIVTCPNYLFEIIAWVGIWLVNGSWSTGLFCLVAGGQMAVWAKKKERRYRKDFPNKYQKKRFAMIPGLI